MDVIQIVTYVLGLVFIAGFISKFVKYSKMPKHLRWELYPIAGETKRPWGGSYLEEPEWWKKPQEEKSLLGELRFMGKEVFFFREYYIKNRSLWYIVYPFHLGVFLFVGFFALLIIGALMMAGDVVISDQTSGFWGKLVYYLTLITGISALVLGALGCLALLIRKLVDSGMSPYTRRIEYFNIVLVMAIFITGICSWGFADSSFSDARAFTKGLITFGDSGSMDVIINSHIILIGLFLAYLPFTNMMHFFIKHFTYNSIRWDDEAHLRGSRLEQELEPVGEYAVSWAAPHISEVKTWSDLAGDNQEKYTYGKEVTRHAKRIDKTE